MVRKEFKCGRCDHHFPADVLDTNDSRERHLEGSPLRCPQCGAFEVEPVRIIERNVRRQAS